MAADGPASLLVHRLLIYGKTTSHLTDEDGMTAFRKPILTNTIPIYTTALSYSYTTLHTLTFDSSTYCLLQGSCK